MGVILWRRQPLSFLEMHLLLFQEGISHLDFQGSELTNIPTLLAHFNPGIIDWNLDYLPGWRRCRCPPHRPSCSTASGRASPGCSACTAPPPATKPNMYTTSEDLTQPDCDLHLVSASNKSKVISSGERADLHSMLPRDLTQAHLNLVMCRIFSLRCIYSLNDLK